MIHNDSQINMNAMSETKCNFLIRFEVVFIEERLFSWAIK